MEWNDGGRLPGVATPAIEPYAALSFSSSNRDGTKEQGGARGCAQLVNRLPHGQIHRPDASMNVSMPVMMINEPGHTDSFDIYDCAPYTRLPCEDRLGA